MKNISMGKTTFGCRNCQTVTVVKNEDLEVMAEFKCPGCGVPMSEARLIRTKILYFAKVYGALTKLPFGGEGSDMFQVDTEFDPHYEVKQSEKNKNQEGGADHRETG